MAYRYHVENLSSDNDHLIQSVLDRFAGDGWKLTTIVPIAGSYGGTRSLKLIFEKLLADVDPQ